MLRTFTVLAFLVITFPAHADWFYRFIGYKCDVSNQRLIVYYKGAYNEAGEAMRKTKSKTEWEPDSLIASMKDDDHIGELKTIARTCKLNDANYQLRIGPTPGNFNIQGSCGAVMTAWVEVKRNKVVVLPKYEMEARCHDTTTPVTTSIVFDASAKPVFTKIPVENFVK